MSEHPTYAKYYKMLKVGLPRDAVMAKMVQEGVDPARLATPADQLVPLNDGPAGSGATGGDVVGVAGGGGEMLPLGDHPAYAKYFKMVKVGLPLAAVKAKMLQEGVDPSKLDQSASDLEPVVPPPALDDGKERVMVKDHPKYAKYFKMMKVGLPKEQVKVKMMQEGANPDFLDKEPDELITVEQDEGGEDSGPSGKKKMFTIVKVAAATKLRKKKLYWKALDESKVADDSLWRDGDNYDIYMDEAEFNQLFVERYVYAYFFFNYVLTYLYRVIYSNI